MEGGSQYLERYQICGESLILWRLLKFVAEILLGADLPITVWRNIRGFHSSAVVEHSTTGEYLFGRTFARRVINRPAEETVNI